MANILLVDDEAMILEIASEFLKEEGHEVMTAGNGLEALTLIDEQGKPDLVVTDGMMPLMTGPQLAQNLDERGIEYVYFTGNSIQYLTESAKRHIPREQYVKKPDFRKVIEIANQYK